jgi:hypothetical protein
MPNDISRRPSKRQLEKAPEGRQPRMHASSNANNNNYANADPPSTTPIAPTTANPDHDDVQLNGNVHRPDVHPRFRDDE